jgi:hypothetical protein
MSGSNFKPKPLFNSEFSISPPWMDDGFGGKACLERSENIQKVYLPKAKPQRLKIRVLYSF